MSVQPSGFRPAGIGPTDLPSAADTAAVDASSRTAAATTLRFGSRGPEVVKLQEDLKKLGFAIGAADGVFGRQTERVVTELQRAKGLTPDGIVGARTQAAIREAIAGLAVDAGVVQTLRLGSSGPQVGRLQSRLIALGYDPGTPDGVFGRKTESAVRAFQRSAGLPTDGVAGPRTLAALDAAGTAGPVATKAWSEGSVISPGNVYATVGGQDKLLARDGMDAFLLDGGRFVAWNTPAGAGGFENEGQGLSVYEAKTGQIRRVMSEYYMVDDVKAVRTSDGRTALLVQMSDGGAGFPHAAIIDPLRGEVARFERAKLVGSGDRITVELHANPDDLNAVTGMGSVDLKLALDGPVITNPRSPM